MSPTDQLSSLILDVIYVVATFFALKFVLDVILWLNEIGWKKVGKYALGTMAFVAFYALGIWYLYWMWTKNHPAR